MIFNKIFTKYIKKGRLILTMKLTEPTIRYAGLNQLSISHQDSLQKFAEKYHEKIQRKIKKLTALRINIKMYDVEGARRKYVINVTTEFAGRNNFRSEAWHYNFPLAVQKAFKNLEFELDHKLHANQQVPGRDIVRRRKMYTKSGRYEE